MSWHNSLWVMFAFIANNRRGKHSFSYHPGNERKVEYLIRVSDFDIQFLEWFSLLKHLGSMILENESDWFMYNFWHNTHETSK